jgi:transglutaminase-like putative cysteine protease
VTEARAAVAVAVLCGLAAVAVVGVLPGAVLAALAVLTVAGAATAQLAPPSRAGRLRAVTAGLVLVAVGVAVGLGTEDLLATLLLLLAGTAAAASLSWLGPADLRTGGLCATGLLVAAAALSGDVLVVPFLVLGLAAVLVAASRVPSLRLAADPALARPPASGRTPLRSGSGLLAPVGLAVLLAGVLALLLPVPDDLRPQGGGSLSGGSSGSASAQAAFTSPLLDLTRRIGEPSTTPVLEVAADSPRLWRSSVYDRYDGSRWLMTARQPARLDGPGPHRLGSTGAPTRVDEARTRRHDGTVWAPGPVVALEAPGAPGSWVDEQGVWRLSSPVERYRVESELPVAHDAALRSAAGSEPVEDGWLQLPAALPERVVGLARQLTAGAATRYDAVVAVETFLETSFEYTLDPPVPRPGDDAVDRFLFVDRAGYCQHFAAAATVLLRAAGIPARVVTGLGHGRRSGDRRIFEVRHLHAWTEVWYPGVGWVAVDPTPAAELAEEPPAASQRLASALRDLLRSVQDALGGRIGLAAALLGLGVVVGLGLLAARRLSRRRGADGGSPAVPRAPAAGTALAAFLRLDGRLGPARRRPAESLGELRGRLAAPDDVAGALLVVERECYGPRPPDEADRAAAVLDAADVEALRAAADGVPVAARHVLPRG